MMGAFTALALNGFREARRNRVSVVVAAFALGLVLTSTLVTEVTVYTFHRVLTDFGLGVMSITMVMLAVFLSSGLLSREIERRTIFLVVSKPVSRSVFLAARLTGNMLTLGAMLLTMAAVFFLQVKLYGAPITASMVIAVGVLWVELLVLSSVGFLMASFSSQMVSAVVTTGVYFAGHLADDIYTLSSGSESATVQQLGKVVYYLVPNLSRLNFRPHAAYEVVPPLADVAQSVGYGLAYSGVLVALAALIFSRRDFR